MSNSAENIFVPGMTIEFVDATELHAFEDALGPHIQPGLDTELWSSRVALKELLRPPKFNGRIGNLALSVMDEPRNHLLNSRDRGWQIKGTNLNKTNSWAYGEDPFTGFTFTADAFSSGRGKIGQIQAELWYAPNPDVRVKEEQPARTVTYTKIHTSTRTGEIRKYEYKQYRKGRKGGAVSMAQYVQGRPLLRVITTPKFETDKFIELQATSQRIGFSVLRAAMMNPIKNGMRN